MRVKYKVFNKQSEEVQDNLTIQQVQSNKGFVMAYQTPHQQLYRDPSLTKGELRVFGYLEAIMDYKNEIDYTQTGIAHDLSMNRTDVTKAINSLIKREVIEKVQHPGKYPVYRVNTAYARKGRQLKAVK